MRVTPFAPKQGPIFIQAQVTGPRRSITIKLLLDTGATKTTIKRSVIINLGLDPERDGYPVKLITGSQTESVQVVTLTRLFALGQNRVGFPVVAHSLPPEANIDGLLGLDFFQGHILTLDFQVGSVTLA